MIRNLEALALAVAAVLALALASAASAPAAQFHATGGPVIVEGEQVEQHSFVVNTGKFNCTTAKFKGTNASATSGTLELAPTYEGCKIFGVKATVASNGCGYLLHAAAGGLPYSATTDIVCPAGKSIVVAPTGVECTISIVAQSGLTSTGLTNNGAKSEVTAALNLEGIAYTEAGAFCSGGTATNGRSTGTTLYRGYVDTGGTKGAQQNIWVE